MCLEIEKSLPNAVQIALKRGDVNSFLSILKLSDEEAYIHSLQVAAIVEKYLEYENANPERSKDEKANIIVGSLLHDIGKAFLPFGLQHSSKKIDKIESEVINMHPLLGLLATKNCGFDKVVTDIILMHHALANGTGYPTVDGLPFKMSQSPGGMDDENSIAVPEYVWIISYADKLAAMVSSRPFKPSKGMRDAYAELVKMSKSELLPYQLLDTYKRVIKDLNILE